MLVPKQIRRSESGDLAVEWNDGITCIISLKALRDNCPCAGCQGETVLFKAYKPQPVPDMPGKYELMGVQQVGSYALQVTWGDGHATGLYTWERLRSLCG
ncbi:MAG: DUF971 domain-containing protein [Ignavibacteriales bacterium]|nr:DUF971 domain-containing protein [Ignavibacteriales bacterium]